MKSFPWSALLPFLIVLLAFGTLAVAIAVLWEPPSASPNDQPCVDDLLQDLTAGRDRALPCDVRPESPDVAQPGKYHALRWAGPDQCFYTRDDVVCTNGIPFTAPSPTTGTGG